MKIYCLFVFIRVHSWPKIQILILPTSFHAAPSGIVYTCILPDRYPKGVLMKILTLVAAVIPGLFLPPAWTQQIVAPARNAPALRSPEVAPDRRVTFRLLAPRAAEVTLTGEFITGSTRLEKNDKGIWSVTLGPLEPEIYHYNFTIDGVRTIDPSNPSLKIGVTPTTIMSMLEERGDHPAFYEGQAVPHGGIRTHWYESKSLNPQ